MADAAGVSYDMVYRDIRQGILPALRLRRGPGHSRYAVSADGLRRSARPCYRHAAPLVAAEVRATQRTLA